MEKLVKIFVDRPVTTAVVAIVMVVLGLQSIPNLDLSMMPDVEYPTMMLMFPAYGMTGKEVEEKVIVPVERVLATVGGVEKIESRAYSGYGMVVVNFKWGTDMGEASIEVSEKLDLVSMYLPRNVRPMVFKFSPEMMPILIVAVSGKDWDAINDTVNEIRTIVERLPEISYVVDMGLKKREVQVLADYEKLIKRFIGLSMVQTTLMTRDFLMSGGIEFGKEKYVPVNVMRKISSLEDLKNIQIPQGLGIGEMAGMMGGMDISSLMSAFLTGPKVLLKDVAQVEMGISQGHSGVNLNGKQAALLVIQKRSGVNMIKACRAVKEALEEYEPKSANVEIVMDQSEYIAESLNTLMRNLVIGAVVVVIVLMAFLRDFRVVLLVSAAIPLSLLVGLILMYFSGMTINIMSLGGLALAVGMLIDNAIVVTESIYRRNELGDSPAVASYRGAGEVGGAITASTLTTISVFLPIAFLQGFAERMFKDLALAVTFTLLASLLISLSFVPSMSQFLIRGAEPRLRRLREAYAGALRKALKKKWIVITVVLVLFVASGFYLYKVGFTLMPSASTYQFRVRFFLPTGTSPEVSKKVAEDIEEYFEKNRERFKIQYIYSSYGMEEGEGITNMLSMDAAYENGFVALRLDRREELMPFDEMKEIIEKELFTKVREKYPGIFLDFLTPVNFQTEMFGRPLEIEIRGESDEILKGITERVLKEIEDLDFLKNIQSTSEKMIKTVRVVPNDDALKKYHLSPMQIAAELSAIHNKKTAGSVMINGRSYDIVVYPMGTEDLKLEDVKLPAMIRRGLVGFSYTLVPLTQVASVVEVEEPYVITHRDGRKVFIVSADIEGVSQSEALKIVRKKLSELSLPEGYSIKVKGQAKVTEKEVKQIIIAAIVGVILMFIVMAGEFESFVQPFIVMFTVPMGIIGVALVYLFLGEPLNIVSLVGVVMLLGIVVNNGIVMVDRINRSRREGMSLIDAVVDGASTRLRPILMTSLTTITALIPEVILKGEGKEFHAPMALTVIGGLSVATFLTLFFIPALYTIIHGKK